MPEVSTSVYVVMIIIMLTALASSWLVLPPAKVIRGDKTLVEAEVSISPKQELHEFVLMFKDWRTLALFPMCFASNYFYAYQGAITAYLFNPRTRALIALLTGVGSVIGATVIGLLTDSLPFGRRKRGLVACGFVSLALCGVWGAGLGLQVQFEREDEKVRGQSVPWDWTVGVSVGPILLVFACKCALEMT